MKHRHLIIVAAGIFLIALTISPFVIPIVTLAHSVHDAKQRVIEQLDHASIRDAARTLLSNLDVKADRMIGDHELPKSIRQTNPNFVHIADGILYIEYGGGFAHYGLVIPPPDVEYLDGKLVADGIFFYEGE